MANGTAYEAFQRLAAPKLRPQTRFEDGVPLLSVDEAAEAIAAELPPLGGPTLTSPALDRLAASVTRTAARLRRADPMDPRAALMDLLADELRDAEAELEEGDHAAAVGRVRRVCLMALCLDEIASHAPVDGGRSADAIGPPASVCPGPPRLRALEPAVPRLAMSCALEPGRPVPDVPWVGPRLGDTVLGAHLRHLRECQDLSWAQIAARLPAAFRADGGTIADLETGTGTTLREAAHRGRLGAYLHAYGAGAAAAADVHQLLTDAELARPGYAIDRGPGRPHRYQLLEQSADSVLLLGAVLVPAALRTPAYAIAASLDAPALRVPGDVPLPQVAPVLEAGCPLCRIYRADLLLDPDAASAWQLGVGAEQAAAFEERLRRPGAPEATVVLSWSALASRFAGAAVHAEQMLHLADLARTTALRVAVLPDDDGYLATHDVAVLRTGGRAVTASSGLCDITYQDGALRRAGMALERALAPDTSIEMLERAAAADLPGRRLW
ncbi:Scr1 family TA system antitoxin-like transcriptional regulator [Kitasatospora sp. NPDC089797]|uniref:Scr1 family TA system antitoxin-like transcriptional regulator n=1 Tax=Kitasatospora sp. NPDC089797 TaxID=3155298 RepID=UPI0034382F32